MEIVKEIMSDVFTKYHIKGLPFDCVIHHFKEPDKGDFHSHPFNFTSHILKGSYIEEQREINGVGGTNYYKYHRQQGTAHKVYCNTIHRIIELPEGECWTLILPEKWQQEPGFYKFEDVIYKRLWHEKEFKVLI